MERSGFTTLFVGIFITNRYTQLHLRYLSYYECILYAEENTKILRGKKMLNTYVFIKKYFLLKQ